MHVKPRILNWCFNKPGLGPDLKRVPVAIRLSYQSCPPPPISAPSRSSLWEDRLLTLAMVNQFIQLMSESLA